MAQNAKGTKPKQQLDKKELIKSLVDKNNLQAAMHQIQQIEMEKKFTQMMATTPATNAGANTGQKTQQRGGSNSGGGRGRGNHHIQGTHSAGDQQKKDGHGHGLNQHHHKNQTQGKSQSLQNINSSSRGGRGGQQHKGTNPSAFHNSQPPPPPPSHSKASSSKPPQRFTVPVPQAQGCAINVHINVNLPNNNQVKKESKPKQVASPASKPFNKHTGAPPTYDQLFGTQPSGDHKAKPQRGRGNRTNKA